ncbi:MAG TPA: lipase maturation factor family protein [Candidatus Methylomirabilis sp.]|nr:lipase maturation factor family protein [Candidatus Methylomirabilis sp.]
MDWTPASVIRWLFDSQSGPANRFLARWIFLRALGLIYFSAFFSLIFQIRGLIGPNGILPAHEYLQALTENYGRAAAHWYAPSLLWFSSSSHALMVLCWVGMAASLLFVANLWPRGMLFVCFLCFLSFVAAAGDFSGYQSDGMLLEAGFLSLFVAPAGFRPHFGDKNPPVRTAFFLLLWEWFRIYFESGVAKIGSGDPEWRHFTAMDEYYQNGPLPTWIGWYAQQRMPHWFHVGSAFLTIALELVVIWAAFLPRPVRIVLFFIVTPWQIGIILTANYTFLNYIVLFLAFLLLDDRFLARFFPSKWTKRLLRRAAESPKDSAGLAARADDLSILSPTTNAPSPTDTATAQDTPARDWKRTIRTALTQLRIAVAAVMLSWVFYSTTAQMLLMLVPDLGLPVAPIALLDPSRIANRFGLFAVMTRGRYEIEFQGSNDGQTWTPYPFRFKPQDVNKAPGIYAPYQPRFDWNLWFASLGEWRGNPLVLRTERRLLSNDSDVLALFAANPFPKSPPRQVRAVLWQYWFTTPAEKKATGAWWRRQLLGLYAPAIELEPDGRLGVTQWPQELPPHE